MKEIKELENKYLVLKWDDINNLDFNHRQMIQEAVLSILRNRAHAGKNEHNYVVLNLDDDISIQYLHDIIHDYFYKLGKTEEFYTVKIKCLAHHLVNAILNAKENR